MLQDFIKKRNEEFDKEFCHAVQMSGLTAFNVKIMTPAAKIEKELAWLLEDCFFKKFWQNEKRTYFECAARAILKKYKLIKRKKK